MIAKPACFKAYDLRGVVPTELDAALAYRVGREYVAEFAPPGPVAVGYDIRESSPELAAAVAAGLVDGGIDVLNLGLCGTESVYFAAGQSGMGGGIMITASHNPREYNGMKLVGAGAKPLASIEGLARRVMGTPSPLVNRRGRIYLEDSLHEGHALKALSFFRPQRPKKLRIVVNAGNGGAGLCVDRLAYRLPFELIRVHHEPDGSFPNGIPNPLLPEGRQATAAAVLESKADFGVAWDGDFDRCFFFDEKGDFIDGYYIVGLLARELLRENRGSKIIYDPRVYWNTIETVRGAGGHPVCSRTGHIFIKEAMRREDAIYGGEMSAHHYFRDFHYCDSGMIPWMLVAALLCDEQVPLSALVAEAKRKFPCSGEINRTVADAAAVVARVRATYAAEALAVDETDGLGMEFANWRFNLRSSQTEPLLRLNVETRGNADLLEERTRDLLTLMDAKGK